MLKYVFDDESEASAMSTYFCSRKLAKISSIAEEIELDPSILDSLDKGDARKLLRALLGLELIRHDCQAVIDFKLFKVRQSVM
jgi:hypothetical protein